MDNQEKSIDVEIEEVMRQYAITKIIEEKELEPLAFVSLEDEELLEERYVDDEEDYNEINLETFL